jgi:hypothetical protein
MRNEGFHWCNFLNDVETLEAEVPEEDDGSKLTSKESIQPAVSVLYRLFFDLILTDFTFTIFELRVHL